jgi:hypothetical protein
MLDSIPIRKRLTALLVLLGLTALLVGIYAKQTFGILGELKSLNQKKPLIDNAPADLKLYEARLAAMDGEIRNLRSRNITISSHSAFIDYAQTLCDSFSVRLVSLPVETRNQLQEYEVASIQFSIEGNYHDILRFIYQMEQKDKIASVEKLELVAEEVRLNEQKVHLLVARFRVNRLLQNS